MTASAVRGETLPVPSAGSGLFPAAAVDIVGCGVLSAAGRGLGPIAAGLAQSPAGLGPDAGGRPGHDPYPPLQLRAVADIHLADVLGPRSVKRMSRTDQLGMAACAMALDEAGPGPAPDRTGIVLGTVVGSGSALADFFRDTFEQKRPYLVSPSHFPGTLMNSAAGKAAIEYRLTGVNATVSGGSLATLQALRVARNTLLNGHARRLLAGGVEELSAHSAWAWYRSGALAHDTALAEGCAVFALQLPETAASVAIETDAADRDMTRTASGGRARLLGRLLACEIGFADPAHGALSASRRLADCIRAALARSGVAPVDVAVAAPGAGGRRRWAAVEERALRDVFGTGAAPWRLRVERVLGETYGASSAMQLAAVLARWQDAHTQTAGERFAIVTSVGSEGSVGCLVVAHSAHTQS
jgi:3-oxoacyl-[acyl-carrier-protein] synthase II